MLSCREVPAEVNQLLDGELPLRRRIALRLHILMCVHCRRYLRQIRLLCESMTQHWGRASDAEVERVMERLREAEDRPEG